MQSDRDGIRKGLRWAVVLLVQTVAVVLLVLAVAWSLMQLAASMPGAV